MASVYCNRELSYKRNCSTLVPLVIFIKHTIYELENSKCRIKSSTSEQTGQNKGRYPEKSIHFQTDRKTRDKELDMKKNELSLRLSDTNVRPINKIYTVPQQRRQAYGI